MDEAFGRTLAEIEGEGHEVLAVIDSDVQSTGRAIGKGVLSACDALDRLAPDAVLVYGDRFEAFAVAIAASQSNIPLLHVEGGDKTEGGALDDSVRHAITKLAHMHFATNADAARRIARLGEEPWRIHDTGLPALDRIASGDFPDPEEVAAKLDLDLGRPLIVFTQHSVTTEADRAGDQLRPSLDAMDDAMERLNAQVVATYPNLDAGGRAILDILTDWAGRRRDVRLRPSLGRALYHGALNVAGRVTRGACLGNSSSGIKETAVFGCPTVNVGSRQEGRLAPENVLHCGYDRAEIFAALERSVTDRAFRERASRAQNPYVRGDTGKRISEILAETDFSAPAMLRKRHLLDDGAA
jgi:UDP-hydrolysing UDP-N-acetyl-D-glucosamine 2-epimerase